MKKTEYHIETLALHAGQIPDPATQARAVPVYRTTAYSFRDSRHGADLFAYREHGNIYARLMNPTNDVLENALPRWKAAGRRLHSEAEPPQSILLSRIFCGRGTN